MEIRVSKGVNVEDKYLQYMIIQNQIIKNLVPNFLEEGNRDEVENFEMSVTDFKRRTTEQPKLHGPKNLHGVEDLVT